MNEASTVGPFLRDDFLNWLESRNPGQAEFRQAVEKVLDDVEPELRQREDLRRHNVMARLAEPDRIISFRVTWSDDRGQVRVNRGWRVQHSGVIGPYKGGIRFHPTVTESVLKFLAFEQTFKNALTGLAMGGGKGGSDFDPRDCSEDEIMRFCQAFMRELHRHIGATTDIPAGDINVGSREIGYLFGEYRRLANHFDGTLTGKQLEFGGSHVRLEATGFGLLYFLVDMLKAAGESIEGKRVLISGAGNVALHAARKAAELGAVVLSLSSSEGMLFCEEGFSTADIDGLLHGDLKSGAALRALAEDGRGRWQDNAAPWTSAGDIALPCATQNELDGDAARNLVEQGCRFVAEGANMPCTAEALQVFEQAGVRHAPGKASN
ncbi:MAG: Glu/Leu/Phe/Val dehydrogenase dimerization domain-containing protein, partial [Halieaceae bacterium]|nr:Glu/Leu/Phe/Val dehydrogenase dimerization domain-containing protein [Halieaceae bacterium]